MKEPIRIVVVDTGPLISLAHANALEILLVFRNEIDLVVTDFVEFEVTRNRDKFEDAKKICKFLSRYAGLVQIQETSIGKTMKQMVKLRDRFESDAGFRQLMIENDSEPPQVPKDMGELSIMSFVNEMIVNPPGIPVLILAEDDFFLRAAAPMPGNAHILSTNAFLNALSELGKIPSAKQIWDDIQRKRPNVKTSHVDRTAAKIDTEWQSSIDTDKAGIIDIILEKKLKQLSEIQEFDARPR